MKKILLSLICMIALITPSLSFAISFKRAQQIYARLVVTNNLYGAPRLYYERDTSRNAYTQYRGQGKIVVYKGLLDDVKNDDELALVLAHELGHWVRRDTQKPFYGEYDSDRWGAYAMDKAGYNHCVGAHILWRFGNITTPTHPPGHGRFLAITKACHAPR